MQTKVAAAGAGASESEDFDISSRTNLRAEEEME
jgi:hypothetical protein